MPATLRGGLKRVFHFLYLLLAGAGRLFLWLMRQLFGLSWHAPLWLRHAGRGLAGLGRKMRARPVVSATIVGLLLAAAGAGWFGWQWYKNLPAPHTVAYTVHAPSITDYRTEPPGVRPLRVQFAESAAPLAAIGKPVTTGVRLTPSQPGAWHWANDRTLIFTPQADWPVDKTFKVHFEQKGLFAGGVLLDAYRAEFRTAAFTASIRENRLYQDPQTPALKKLVATVRFSHPVDQKRFRDHVSIELGTGLGYRETDVAVAPEITFDGLGLEAYVHSAPLATPLEGTRATLRIREGVGARDGGNRAAEMVGDIQVPGRYQLAFHSFRIQFANNDRGETEPVLMIQSSSAVTDEVISAGVHAWLLPETRNEQETRRYNWHPNHIDQKVLDRADEVALTHIPSLEPLNSLHAFKFKIPVGRQLYVKVDRHTEALGGYLNKDPAYHLLTMPAYPKMLRFLSDGALLGLNGERRVGFTARGLTGAHVEIARLLPHQLHHLVDQNDGNFAQPYLSDRYFDRLVERMSKDIALPSGDPSKNQYGHVDFNDYLSAEGGRRGVFVVRLSSRQYAHRSTFSHQSTEGDLRFIVVTDLGLIAKRSADGSHDVFVQSIGSGLPVAGARVEVIGRNGLPVAEAAADADGRAHFAGLNELARERAPLMYVVSHGNDLSFLPVNDGSRVLDYSRFDVGGIREAGIQNRLQGYLFTDRGLYRPGETAHLGMIVRSADWGTALQGMPLELLVHDPRGMTVMRETFKLDADGFEARDFTTGDVAPTGTYQATLNLVGRQNRRTRLGGVSFNVREFEPDRMKLALTLSNTTVAGWLKPEQVRASVRAMHLFGAPASDRRVVGELFLSPAQVAFARYPDYRFRVDDQLKQAVTEQVAELRTDANGVAVFDLMLKRFARSTYRLHLTARVFEADSGRGVGTESSMLVSDADYLIGVKAADSLDYVPKGAQREIHWLAIGQDLAPRAVEGLTVERVEHRYVSVLVRQGDGTYRYESHVKDYGRPALALSLPAEGATVKLETGEPGDYSLMLRDAAGNLLSRVDYSVAGQANVSRSLERNAELQLRLNKSSFSVGEDIAVSIRAPYVGAGLITIERDRIYAQQWFKTDTTSSVQHIRVPEGLEGNAYVNVQFVRDPGSDDVFTSPLSYGVAPFSIDLDGRRVPLALNAAGHVEPGQTLDIRVASDRPVRAVVFAVDEGILQVANYRTPDPLGFFFRKRALEVDTRQVLDLILPEFSRLLTSAAPGGDDEAALAAHLNPFKRKRKPPVAWWSGLIELPAGETVLHYPVPDSFNGRLRLFAVAVDPQRIGVAENASEVRGPLIITPNVPAFVAPGDAFTVSVGLFSNLEEPATIRYRMRTGDGLRVGEGEAETVLSPRRETTVEFHLTALDAPGAVDLSVIAVLPDGKEVTAAEHISVRPANTYRTRLQLGRFDNKTTELTPQRDLFEPYRKVTLSAAASPLAWTAGLDQYLENYSYGCTEQILSRAMPAVVWAQQRERAQPAFDAAVRMLRQRQNQNGGFGAWAASIEEAPFASLYAVDFMLEAKRRGYAVPEDLLENANRYLSQLANGPSNGLYELRHRAYASYLLTRQGVVVSSALSDIRERYQKFHVDAWQTDPGALWLAASYKLLKQDTLADPLIAKQPWRLLEEKWSRDGLYYDPLMQDAIHLQIVTEHFPQRLGRVPSELLARLGQRLNEQRYNSLSAALLIRALDHYEQLAAAEMNLQVSALLDAGRQQPLTLAGRPPQVAVPYGTVRLTLDKATDTQAFFAFSEAGFDRSPDLPAFDQGLEIVRDYLDLAGNPIEQARVGDEFLVRLRLRAVDRDHAPQIAVVELLPGGVEPVYNSAPEPGENGEDEGGDEGYRYPVGEPTRIDWSPHYIDVREDRIVLYGDVRRDAGTFTYRVRATNAGRFVTPSPYAEGMYDSTLQSRGKPGRLDIVAPGNAHAAP